MGNIRIIRKKQHNNYLKKVINFSVNFFITVTGKLSYYNVAQLAGAAEYTNYISAVG